MMFEVRPALVENIDSGSVWVTLSSEIPSRSVVKISKKAPGKEKAKNIYCEALAVGAHFVERYNSDHVESLRLAVTFDPSSKRALPDSDGKGLIFLSASYRTRLGGTKEFEEFEDHELSVSRADGWFGRTRACLQHPQVSVRLGTVLGLLGFGLGILGIALGVVAVCLALLALQHK
jgi:hypothetical protein